MRSLLRLFWEVCLLRKGPQDMPFSRELLALLIGAGLVVDVVRLSFADTGMDLAGVLIFALAALGLNLAFLAGLPALLGYRARVVQTLIAWFGAMLLIGLVDLPLVLLLRVSPELGAGVAFLFQLLVIWSLLVTMHILRHTLSINPVLAGVLTLGYFLLSVLLYNAMVKSLI